MTSAREPASTPDEPADVTPVEPADLLKPVELIELLQRRSAKRKRADAPTLSPFYDADFVAKHRKRNDATSD